jgi:predicted ferric reductase
MIMTDDKAARLAAIRAANAARAAAAHPPATDAHATDDAPPAIAPAALALMLAGAAGGALAAALVLPAVAPTISTSLLGENPKAYWYLSRSSAVVAYVLLWMAMMFGMLITSKTARLWPGGPLALELHQHASLLGLAFSVFHALILLGDHYANASLASLFVPLGFVSYRPLWVAAGQVAFYALAIIGLSFYVKHYIGRRVWRAIHVASFATFGLALAHGIAAGSDTETPLMQGVYWLSGASVVFLTCYRVLVSLIVRPAARDAQRT